MITKYMKGIKWVMTIISSYTLLFIKRSLNKSDERKTTTKLNGLKSYNQVLFKFFFFFYSFSHYFKIIKYK